MLHLYTESVSVYAVLRECVFVAESDDVFREEGANGDAHVVSVRGATVIFFRFQLAGQPPQTPQIPHFGGGATHGLRCGILLCPR